MVLNGQGVADGIGEARVGARIGGGHFDAGVIDKRGDFGGDGILAPVGPSHAVDALELGLGGGLEVADEVVADLVVVFAGLIGEDDVLAGEAVFAGVLGGAGFAGAGSWSV